MFCHYLAKKKRHITSKEKQHMLVLFYIFFASRGKSIWETFGSA